VVRVAVAKTSPSRHGAQDQDPREATASNIRTLVLNNDFLNETLKPSWHLFSQLFWRTFQRSFHDFFYKPDSCTFTLLFSHTN